MEVEGQDQQSSNKVINPINISLELLELGVILTPQSLGHPSTPTLQIQFTHELVHCERLLPQVLRQSPLDHQPFEAHLEESILSVHSTDGVEIGGSGRCSDGGDVVAIPSDVGRLSTVRQLRGVLWCEE